MCRYAFSGPYKEHFACFHCRKAFKQTPRKELVQKMPLGQDGKRLALCPECRRPMHDMGLDFHTPRQADVRQWRKVALLYGHGITYHSCGCGPGHRPATLAEVPEFLDQQRTFRAEQERRRVKKLRQEK
jgi:hypothetical protein